MEIRFKPALVGTVEDGAITTPKLADEAVTDAKVNTIANIQQTKVQNLPTDLAKKVENGPLTGDKKVLGLGYDTTTEEIIYNVED